MGYQLANGSKLTLSKTLATPIAFTAISAATDAVLTVGSNSGADAIVKGDVVYFTKSSNAELLYLPCIVKAATTTAITILGLDTTDTATYPAGITGEITKVKDYVDLPLTSTIANSGGDANTTTVQFIQDDKARNLFTTTNPSITTLTMAHDSTDVARPILEKYTKSQAFVVYRVLNAKAAGGAGEWRLYTVQIQFNGNPVMAVNEVENVSAAMTIQKGPKIYLKSAVDAL